MFVFFKDIDPKLDIRQRKEMSQAFTKTCLCKVTMLNAEQIILEDSQFGKPSLKNANQWQFSLSHSANLIGIAIVKNTPVGFDLQAHLGFNPSLSENVFSPQEQSQFSAMKSFEKIQFFYRQWTIKEAALKALGLGLRYPMKQMQVNEPLALVELLDQDHELLAKPIPKLSFRSVHCRAEFSCFIVLSQSTSTTDLVETPEITHLV